MSIRSMLFAAAFALASVEAAHADSLRPIEAKSIDLGEVSGVAYYTSSAMVSMLSRPLRRAWRDCRSVLCLFLHRVRVWFSQHHHTRQVRSKSAGTATACSSARRKQSRTKFRANWRLLT
jgi:hypothetical protein